MTLTTSLINRGLCRTIPYSNNRNLFKPRKDGSLFPSISPYCDTPTDLDPENPWDMISKAQKWLTCTEDENINSILDGNSSFDPNEARHRMFQAIMLMSYGYMYEKFKKDKEEENKKALKETFDLAFAAR